MRKLMIAACAILAMSGVAAAAQPKLSAQDRQILKELSPEDRKEVLSRLEPGQSVQGVVETMALNRLSAMYAEGRIVELDVIKGEAVVQYKDGTRKTVQFEIDEIVVAD